MMHRNRKSGNWLRVRRSKNGIVRIACGVRDLIAVPFEATPKRARAIAADLLKKADEAEGKP